MITGLAGSLMHTFFKRNIIYSTIDLMRKKNANTSFQTKCAVNNINKKGENDFWRIYEIACMQMYDYG